MESFKTISRELILDMGSFLKVESHVIELPNGDLIEDWSWVVTPDYVNVVAITDDEEWIVLRQTKYAVEGVTLAPVGGYLELGEAPLDAAKRELLEETGFVSDYWIELGSFAVDGNRGAGTAYAFIALNASHKQEPNADDLEEQAILFLDRPAIEQALFGGEFKVLPWSNIIALSLLLSNRKFSV